MSIPDTGYFPPLAIPAELDAFNAAVWVTAGLLFASVERRWSRSELQQALFWIIVSTLHDRASDDELVSELRQALARCRKPDAAGTTANTLRGKK